MKSITELTSYIRFQLSQLRVQNKHHDFEHLARHLARLRICENILPGTGPVSAGGDQGRDFESYRTYLNSTPIATSTFLARATDKKLVFACSLQQDIVPKIRADVSIICGGQQPHGVDGIFYFCEADLAVAKRHQLQQWCRQEFRTDLEILDGQAIAEQLTGLDVFWIAEQYLEVDSELYPRPDRRTSIYDQYKEHWLTSDATPWSYSDFFQIKYGLRVATFNEEDKPDLRRWIRKMEIYLGKMHPLDLQRRAAYEVCVATLRGLNNLTERRELVEQYLSDIPAISTTSDLQDATNLLVYCSGAYVRHHFDINVATLIEWTRTLTARIDHLLANAGGPGARCRLLQIRGQAGYLQFRNGSQPEIDLTDTFSWWSQLLEEVKNAPLFPLEGFADLLTAMTEFVGDDERFLALTRTTDELLSTRSSGYLAAEKCRDRAASYYEAENYLLAIKQLHQAKVKWFSAETLRGSLLSMLVLALCYQRLGLAYAAKYCAACVAFLCLHQDQEDIKPLIPRALFTLADCSYQAGEWVTFAQITELALAAHNLYDQQPLDITKHEELQRVFAHTAIVRTITGRLDRRLATVFDGVFSKWPIDQGTREGIQDISDGGSFWDVATPDEIRSVAQQQLTGRPFCDVGITRSISCKALGVAWEIEFENDYVSSAASEELAATIQIIVADLAHRDLILLPTKVVLRIHTTDSQNLTVEEIPNNKVSTWKVGFPRGWIQNVETIDQSRSEILALAITVLGQCSLLEHAQLMRELDEAFASGLPSKTFVVRPYSELYVEFLSEDTFSSVERRNGAPVFLPREFTTSEHPQLAWKGNDGPGYSREKAIEILGNRYANAIRPIRLTLRRLLGNGRFRELIRRFRHQGFLDWEILVMLSNICVSYRIDRILPRTAPLSEQEHLIRELSFQDETDQDIEVPIDIFTEERCRMQLQVSVAAVARTWGLVTHQRTPDFAALERVLDIRYHNSEDDVEHDDPFGV